VAFTLAEQLQKTTGLSQVQQGELVQLWRQYKAEQAAQEAEDTWVVAFVTERYGLKPKSQAPAEVHMPQSCYTTEDAADEDAWVEQFVTERYGFGQPSNHPGRAHLQRL